MCTLTARTPAEQLYGAEPCRSLFAEYTISLPKIGADHPSNSGTATKNSKLLDVSRKKIKCLNSPFDVISNPDIFHIACVKSFAYLSLYSIQKLSVFNRAMPYYSLLIHIPDWATEVKKY